MRGGKRRRGGPRGGSISPSETTTHRFYPLRLSAAAVAWTPCCSVGESSVQYIFTNLWTSWGVALARKQGGRRAGEGEEIPTLRSSSRERGKENRGGGGGRIGVVIGLMGTCERTSSCPGGEVRDAAQDEEGKQNLLSWGFSRAWTHPVQLSFTHAFFWARVATSHNKNPFIHSFQRSAVAPPWATPQEKEGQRSLVHLSQRVLHTRPWSVPCGLRGCQKPRSVLMHRSRVSKWVAGWPAGEGFIQLRRRGHLCVSSACSDSVHLASPAHTGPKTNDKWETTKTRVARTRLIAGSDRPDSSDRNKPEQSQWTTREETVRQFSFSPVTWLNCFQKAVIHINQ